MRKTEEQRKCYSFFEEMLEKDIDFSLSEFVVATGWKKATVTTYLSKQYWKDIVLERDNRYVVLPKFRDISIDEFFELMTQVKNP